MAIAGGEDPIDLQLDHGQDLGLKSKQGHAPMGTALGGMDGFMQEGSPHNFQGNCDWRDPDCSSSRIKLAIRRCRGWSLEKNMEALANQLCP
jgi:hypothetical protein